MYYSIYYYMVNQNFWGNPTFSLSKLYDHITSFLMYCAVFQVSSPKSWTYVHCPARAKLHCQGLLHIEYLFAMQFASLFWYTAQYKCQYIEYKYITYIFFVYLYRKLVTTYLYIVRPYLHSIRLGDAHFDIGILVCRQVYSSCLILPQLLAMQGRHNQVCTCLRTTYFSK